MYVPTTPVMGLLRPNRRADAARVRVLVHGGPALDALVSRSVDGAAELVLVGGPALAPRFLHRSAATLVQDDVRLEATLLAVADERGARVRDDVLHAVWLGEQDGIQRREHARITVVRPVTVVPDGLERGWLRGRTRDVSAGGALISGVPQLQPGHRLRLLLDLADQEDTQLDVQATVVRAGEDGLRALDFGSLRPGDRDRIARWVRRREIEALRRLREQRPE